MIKNDFYKYLTYNNLYLFYQPTSAKSVKLVLSVAEASAFYIEFDFSAKDPKYHFHPSNNFGISDRYGFIKNLAPA